MLDFDLCRDMSMDESGMEQAVAAFWGNDRYCPRPGRELWHIFKAQDLQTSDECFDLLDFPDRNEQRILSRLFIDRVEKWRRVRLFVFV
jgi:hypothetical protein